MFDTIEPYSLQLNISMLCLWQMIIGWIFDIIEYMFHSMESIFDSIECMFDSMESLFGWIESIFDSMEYI